MMRRGLLLTMTEPPAAMEEELNAWYDSEHLAERLAITQALLLVAQDAPFETPRIPGPLQARRRVAHPGTPAYMALIALAWSEPAGLPYRAYGA